MRTIRQIQERLVELGYNPGVVDGLNGPNTKAAVKAFQRDYGLGVDGIVGPKTEPILFGLKSKVKTPDSMPPWMEEMYRRMGLHEVRDNKTLSYWLKIGKYLGNPKNLPWCGDAVETCIVKTLPNEEVPSNPFWAQGWNTFGIDVRQPIVGSIGVIRWSSSSGHVGFVSGISGNTVYLLGGNQSNTINISGFSKSKFIGYRWPKTYSVKNYPALKGSAIVISDVNQTR